MLRDYIKDGWVKARTRAGNNDLDLPFPFVPPCIIGEFRTLYYWDTYFTNIGLIADGHTDWAKENVDNLLFALKVFGCVPNYTRKDGAKFCSQPPLLSLMIQDVYEKTKDDIWLKNAVESLEKEYEFWMTKRITSIGLNRYGCNETDEKELADYYDYVATRISLNQDITQKEKATIAPNFVAEAESGEDFNPRFKGHKALSYAAIDINSHLYGVEDFLSGYYKNKNAEKAEFYTRAKARRKELIEKYCFDKATGTYYDYDYVNGKRSGIICAACFLPYFYGFAIDDGNISLVYETLKTKSGIAACMNMGENAYQWGYPFVWSPHQFFAYKALINYGQKEKAEELRKNHVDILSCVYEKTGCLWERYDESGEAKDLEYPTQKMLGWTAGTYEYFVSQEK